MDAPPPNPVTRLRRGAARVYYGWWLVAVLGAILGLASSTMIFGAGMLVEPLMAEFGWSALAVSVAFSLRTKAGAIASPLTGFLIDRVGSRGATVAGLAAIVAALVWLSTIDGLWGYYGAFCLMAVGNSTIGGQGATVVVARWFVRQRARAVAAVWLGPGLAVGTIPLLAYLIEHDGWRAAVLFWAGVVALVCIPLALLIRERPEHHGLLPDGDPPEAAAPWAKQRDAVTRRAAEMRGSSLTVGQALRNGVFWRLAVVFALATMGNAPVFSLFVPALLKEGISREVAAFALAAQPLLFTAMRLLVVRWGDIFDRRTALLGCFAFQGVALCMLAFTTAASAWLLAPFLLLYAIGWSAQIPYRGAVVSDYFGVEALGTIQGLLQFVSTMGGVLGPIIVGGMADHMGTYRWAWLVLGIAALLSLPVLRSLPAASMGRLRS